MPDTYHSRMAGPTRFCCLDRFTTSSKKKTVFYLREAHRIVKRGGRIWGSTISRFAPVLDSVLHGFFADPTFLEILDRDIEEGQHRNTTNNPLYFTDAFLH